MAIPAQALYKLMTQNTSPVLLNNASSELMKLASSISPESTIGSSSPKFSIAAMNNNMISPNKESKMSSSPLSASKRNKRKSLEPKKVNTLDVESTNNNSNGMIRKLDFDTVVNHSATRSASVTRYFESSSPSGNSQKSDVSVDSGNSSSCCRSPSPDSLSPKRSRISNAPPKKRFKEDPTLNLVMSDIKDSIEGPKTSEPKKSSSPFRPWGNCDKEEEEEEINDDEDDVFVDVERQSPVPQLQSSQFSSSRGVYQGNQTNPIPSQFGGITPNFLGSNALPVLPTTPVIPPLPITPQLITANHQQLVQASQNLLTLSKLYPSLVDMNALASVAAAAQLAASTAAAATSPGSITKNVSPLQKQLANSSLNVQSPHRPYLAGIQEQYSMAGKLQQGVEPEQEEPLALIKKPAKAESAEKAVQPINYTVSKKMASLKENHKPSKPGNLTRESVLERINNPNKKAGKKSPSTVSEKTTQQQRNYKNMTRERRVEANARERQRVHTITAAFDTLQSLIPSPEDVAESSSKSSSSDSDVNPLSNLANQKLSKLSIIKIATSYIMLLSRMAGHDYTEDKSAPSIEDCVKKCSELLTQETKVKRSRDTILKVENN